MYTYLLHAKNFKARNLMHSLSFIFLTKGTELSIQSALSIFPFCGVMLNQSHFVVNYFLYLTFFFFYKMWSYIYLCLKDDFKIILYQFISKILNISFIWTVCLKKGPQIKTIVQKALFSNIMSYYYSLKLESL
jgi:hypothetical protein